MVEALLSVDVRPPSSLASLRVRPALPGERGLIRSFVARFHSTLPSSPAVWVTAFVLEDLASNVWGVGIWSHPTARLEDQRFTFELSRYALGPGLPPNAASWALARMRAFIRRFYPHVTRLITYSDDTVHSGSIYRADNWRLVYSGRREYSPWSSRPGRTAVTCVLRSKWERVP